MYVQIWNMFLNLFKPLHHPNIDILARKKGTFRWWLIIGIVIRLYSNHSWKMWNVRNVNKKPTFSAQSFFLYIIRIGVMTTPYQKKKKISTKIAPSLFRTIMSIVLNIISIVKYIIFKPFYMEIFLWLILFMLLYNLFSINSKRISLYSFSLLDLYFYLKFPYYWWQHLNLKVLCWQRTTISNYKIKFAVWSNFRFIWEMLQCVYL